MFSGNYPSLWAVGERQKQFNFFAQDEWKARSNLTVTYGVRWEINKAPTEVSESPYVPNKAVDGSQGAVTFVKANSWYQGNNLGALAPRIGVAWSPRGRRTRWSMPATALPLIPFRLINQQPWRIRFRDLPIRVQQTPMDLYP